MMLEQNIRAWPATKLVIIDTLSTFCADDRAYRLAALHGSSTRSQSVEMWRSW